MPEVDLQKIASTYPYETPWFSITEMHALAWSEIVIMIKNGEIVDGLSIAALMKYYAERI